MNDVRSWKKNEKPFITKRCDRPLFELCHNCPLYNILAMSNDLLKYRFHADDI